MPKSASKQVLKPIQKKQLERDLQLIYEIGCLRFISRAWRQFLGVDFANLAEHHLRVAWIALMLAKHTADVDEAKILKMALIHDVPESRTGDVHYISRLYTKRNEGAALKDILSGTTVRNEFLDIWHEYESKKSLEAKLVKDADTLDVNMELKEQKALGINLYDLWQPQRNNGVYKRLLTHAGKRFWEQLEKSEPHDWHALGKNRHNFGDWSK